MWTPRGRPLPTHPSSSSPKTTSTASARTLNTQSQSQKNLVSYQSIAPRNTTFYETDKPVGYGKDKYFAVPDGQHLLHCLNEVRKFAFYDYYYAPTFGPASNLSVMHAVHRSHCFGVLLDALTCQPSLSMVLFEWMEGVEEPWPDFDVVRYVAPIYGSGYCALTLRLQAVCESWGVLRLGSAGTSACGEDQGLGLGEEREREADVGGAAELAWWGRPCRNPRAWSWAQWRITMTAPDVGNELSVPRRCNGLVNRSLSVRLTEPYYIRDDFRTLSARQWSKLGSARDHHFTNYRDPFSTFSVPFLAAILSTDGQVDIHIQGGHYKDGGVQRSPVTHCSRWMPTWVESNNLHHGRQNLIASKILMSSMLNTWLLQCPAFCSQS